MNYHLNRMDKIIDCSLVSFARPGCRPALPYALVGVAPRNMLIAVPEAAPEQPPHRREKPRQRERFAIPCGQKHGIFVYTDEGGLRCSKRDNGRELSAHEHSTRVGLGEGKVSYRTRHRHRQPPAQALFNVKFEWLGSTAYTCEFARSLAR